jgi:hypothetical protein
VAHRRRTTAAAVALPGADAKYERGHGPCLDAARTGTLTEIADARTDIRWPGYMSRAAEHGNLSSLSVPLAIDEDEQVSGALNIQPASRTPSTRTAARRPPAQVSMPTTASSVRSPTTSSAPANYPPKSPQAPASCPEGATRALRSA